MTNGDVGTRVKIAALASAGDHHRHNKKTPWIQPIGKAHDGTDNAAGNKPNLHGTGEEGLLEARQLELGSQGRNDRRRRKPQVIAATSA